MWAIYFDQDGAEPRDVRAARRRGLRIGPLRDGIMAVSGNLLAEVGAQLQLVLDCLNNPRVDGAAATGPCFEPAFAGGADAGTVDEPDPALLAAADTRTRTQKQHDAFATMLSKVAASGALPTSGGAAPTLVVSVREDDVMAGRGYAHISGLDEPVSLGVARHIACTGAVQRIVHDDAGRIVSISTLDRVFNHHQRRAIGLRDGGCLIPGCQVPAEWCEIHHVQEHSRGGPTHTDNGVLLCWHHHRTIDTGGWKIRMNRGVPEVRGPSWWDASRRWRAATTSPTRMRERVARRT